MRNRTIKRAEKQGLVETPKRIFNKRSAYAEETISRELGKKYIEYRNKWVSASARQIVTKFPLYLQIENVGKCNLHCPSCIQGIKELRDNYTKGMLPLSAKLFKNILTEAKKYRCPSISFHNNDEPLLLPDLEERISLARKAGFLDIILTTNATLLTKDRTLKLLEAGLTKINFSVDAFDENDYHVKRPGGNFKQVLGNISYFLNQKKIKKLKLPVTRVTCVLNKFGIKNMDKFYSFWKDRVDMVEFQNFQAIKGYTEKFKPIKAKIDKKFICNAPWQQLVIRPNGDVLPCCAFYGIDMVIGNIRKTSLYDIWNSGKMKLIRRELLMNNFDFSPACKKCSETCYVL